MRHPDIAIRMAVLVGLALGTGAVGCSGNADGGMDKTVRNVGNLCVFPAGITDGDPMVYAGGAQDYAAGQPANLAVLFDVCLSSSCMTNARASCTPTQEGDVFHVDATLTYHDTGASTCTTDCGRQIARCTTPPLDAGTFTFNFSGFNTQLAVPSSVVPPCVGTQR
jgi:hypothetical protein